MKAEILNWKKEKTADIDLPPNLFQQEVKWELINEVVRWGRAGLRKGNHKTKTRAEVSGGGKKPFRQKGTGNARQGSIRSPLNRGGGATFGPRPRSYKYNLPLQIRRTALNQTLSYLWKEKKVFILEDMKSAEGKTKELYGRLQNFGLKKALLTDQDAEPLFKRACANLKSFSFVPVERLNVYDLLKYGHLMMSQKSLSFLIEKYKKTQSEKKQDGVSLKKQEKGT